MLKLLGLGVAALAASLLQIPSLTYSTPSSSMSPTLNPGDYMLFPIFFGGDPRPGDVVIFNVAVPGDGHTAYVKRVVGLPGDRVQYVDGRLVVNGAPAERTAIDVPGATPRDYASAKAFRESLGAARYDILEIEDNSFLDNTPVYEVPTGTYFTLGDNRDNSTDSRVQSAVGFVPADAIVGRVCYVFRFPFSFRNICTAEPA